MPGTVPFPSTVDPAPASLVEVDQRPVSRRVLCRRRLGPAISPEQVTGSPSLRLIRYLTVILIVDFALDGAESP